MINISVSLVVDALQFQAERNHIICCFNISLAPDVIFFFGVETGHLDLQRWKHSPESQSHRRLRISEHA